MAGFFSTEEKVKRQPLPVIPQCGSCGLYKGCNSPKMPVSGEGRLGVLLIGEAPGKNEDEQGIQFCGVSGQRLEETLREIDVDMRRDCWITNSIICRPPGNRTPSEKQLQYCRPNLANAISKLRPKVIIPLGGSPIKSLLSGIWREDGGQKGVERWVGWRIPCGQLGAWICPNWHPAFLERENHPVLERDFKRNLRRAFAKKKRPEKIDYESKVQVIMSPDEATKVIREFSNQKKPTAFDFETNMLKPDSERAKIVCCSISDGDCTIAFPWLGSAVQATRDFIRSSTPKIGANIKFEKRWTRRLLRCGVKNFAWDVVNQAHVFDNRPGITSVKFQAFVHLGVPAWDEKVKPFLENPKNWSKNAPNRIDKVDLHELLSYCGIDSLMEILIYQKQKELFSDERGRNSVAKRDG